MFRPVLAALLLAPLLATSVACDAKSPSGATAATPQQGGLTIVGTQSERPTFFDLGTLAYGAAAQHVFRIQNDEGRPVKVVDLLASCGCAVPRISYRAADGTVVEGKPHAKDCVITLPPGAIAELAVRIDTEHVEQMNQDKLAQVRLRSDSGVTPYLTFELHLVVERLMRAVPAAIELGQTPQSAGKSGRADVTAELPPSPARVLGIESVTGPFTATVDEIHNAGEAVWILVANVNPGLPIGPVAGKIVLSVTQPDGTGVGRPFTVPVSAQIAPDVVLRPPVLMLGAIARGTSASAEGLLVALVPGERIRVEKATIEVEPPAAQGWIRVEANPVDPDASGRAEAWTVVLRTSGDLAEPAFGGTIVIATDHPRVQEVRAAFSGTTR